MGWSLFSPQPSYGLITPKIKILGKDLNNAEGLSNCQEELPHRCIHMGFHRMPQCMLLRKRKMSIKKYRLLELGAHLGVTKKLWQWDWGR